MIEDKKQRELKIEYRTCELCHGLGCNMCYMGSYSIIVNEDGVPSIF